MPPRRSNRKKKSTTRRKYNRTRHVSLGFPQKKLIKLRYTQSIVLNAAAGAVVYNDFSCNSIYDPNAAAGGHQPLNHDQWAVLYNRYTVLGSKCIARCLPSTSTATVPGQWSVIITRSTGAVSGKTSTDLIEQKYSSPYQVQSCGGNSSFGGRSNVVTKTWSAKKWLGLGKGTVINHADAQANFGANPAKQNYFTLWYGHTASNDPAPQEFQVTIEYIVMLTEPKIQAAS